MKDKLEQLMVMALKISDEATKLEIDPRYIAIRLPSGYWMDALMSKHFRDYAVYHPESNIDKFELCGITFYNHRAKLDWMKP